MELGYIRPLLARKNPVLQRKNGVYRVLEL
jgi:hypothetical protein